MADTTTKLPAATESKSPEKSKHALNCIQLIVFLVKHFFSTIILLFF